MEYVLVSAIIGLICGTAAVVISEGKGYPKSSNAKWFAIGFFLGPIGVVVALHSGKETKGLVERGEMKICPFCKETVLSEAVTMQALRVKA
ncbi:MAG: hypothetical protein HGB35_07015 [Geobacteraceae bacterium]|nr:hypothetical protein [Geobacteraceae bacterium]